MSRTSSIQPHARTRKSLRIGSVSYLNARPLIYGLDEAEDLNLTLDVPSRLLQGMQQRLFDVALLPVIDYLRMERLRLLPVGGIGSEGETLTVRIFSPRPIEQIETLACDTDSHTSVALARIILSEHYGLQPEFVDLRSDRHRQAQAMLLIGDKVVCEEPVGLEHQLDLGAAWKELTGLPFVFAAWMAREDVELGDLLDRLERAKRDGLANVSEIITRHAVPRGWPAGVALQYLTLYMRYDIGPRQLEAIRLFHRKAAEHGIVPAPPRELRVLSPTP